MRLFTKLLTLFCVFPFVRLTAQVTLPFTEGFENIGSTTTFTSSKTSISGLPDWAYEKTNTGRLRFKMGSAFYHSGTAAATFDSYTANQQSTNYLILSLDLSNYKSSQLELSFYFMHHGEESNNEDRVWIRGSSTDTWVEAYNWYNNRGNAGEWHKVKALDVDGILAKASQKVSSTFQIRFGQADNYPTRSTTLDDGLTIDDISLVERFNRDGQVLAFKNYCSGTSNLQASVYNNGLDTIRTAQIDWWVNGKKQKGGKFSGSILPGKTSLVSLGSTTFSTGTNLIIAVVDSINGKIDGYRNDTLKQSKSPGLSGKYTVGGSGADFSNLDDAIKALNLRGVCAPVVMSLSAGTYSGSYLIGNIDGASKTNTIIFDGLDSTKAIISHNSTGSRNTLALNGAQWISFKNIKIQTTASSIAWLAYLYNGCRNISFENCWFNMTTSGVSQDVLGIVASSSASAETGSGDNIQNLVIKNCNFYGGERSIQIMGSLSPSSSSFTISDNVFTQAYYSSLGLYNLKQISIERNNFSLFRNTNANAVVIYDMDEFTFESNFISSKNYGFYGQNINLNGNSSSSFKNNIITTSGSGAYFNNASTVDIQHNTIVGNPAMRFYDYASIDLRNNIFYGQGGYAFYCPQENGFSQLDWNVYYSTVTNKYNYGNTNFNSLSAFKNVYPDINLYSTEKAPPFISLANPHLTSTTQANRAPSVGLVYDIDADLRCTIAPSIGADESTYKESKPKAQFSIRDSSFVNAIVKATNSATLTDLNTYVWYVNGNKVDSGSLHLNYKFSKIGRNKVTLRSINCGGTDTISKFIAIKKLSKPVIPRFNVDKTKVKVGEVVTLLNKSINGPETLLWSLTPYFNSSKGKNYVFTDGTDSGSYDAKIFFTTPGNYTVCLFASNKLGGSQKCKTNFITVLDQAEMCGSVSSNVSDGVLRDPGGLNNYAGNQGYNCHFTLIPCAKNLKLTFTEFDLTNNRDYLKIYEGTDNTGKALHNYKSTYSNGLTGNSSASGFQKLLVSKSGKVYFEFTTNWFFGAPGFEIEWSGTPKKVVAPIADFEISDTICVGSQLAIENKSSGQDNQYFWKIMSKVTNTVEYTDSAVNHFFFFSGKYSVQLIVKNCGGYDTLVKEIMVVEAKEKPKAKLSVDIFRPDVGQVVTLNDISTVKGYICSEYRNWQITPAKFAYVSGYGAQSQITKVTFQDTGCYNIRLIASNSAGIDTILVKCAVRVKKTCTPKVTNLDPDIGIERVVLEKIDNTSAAGITAYTDYRNTNRTTLQKGVKYELKIFRARNPQSDLNRMAWIDFNQDGDFDDKGETIAASNAPNKSLFEVFTIKIPESAKLGATTLRIAVSKNNSSNTPCGTNVNGEYEDYRVDIVNDTEAPKIYLFGDKIVQIEQCANWTDPMGYAIDNAIIDTIKLAVSGKVNYAKAGTYILTYTAQDSSNNTASTKRTIVVLPDTTKPSIILKGNDTIWVEVNTSYSELGYYASDNCNLKSDAITGIVDVNKLGAYSILYEALDSSGNKTTVIRLVIVQDTKAPKVDKFIGGSIVNHQINTVFIDSGIVYSDNYWANIDIKITVKGIVDATVKGDYTIWYILEDKSGNRDSFARKVIVGDFLTPKITLLGNANETIDVFTKYNDDGVEYKNYDGGTTGLTLTVSGTYVDSFGYNNAATRIGTYTLIYIVTNTTGGKSQVVRYINVVDRVAPVITLLGKNPMIIKQFGAFDEPGWTVADNYWKKPFVWVYTYGVVNTLVPDTYFVYYYAADSSANKSTAISRMVIVDRAIGLNEKLENQISIYPNPSKALLYINIQNSTELLEITIFDQLGRKVESLNAAKIQGNSLALNISQWQSGLYFFSFKYQNGFVLKKIIKED